MKKLFVVVALLFGLTGLASAQSYPYTNPTYVPNAAFPAFTVASNVAASPMTLSGIGTVAVQFTGTCTGLQGRLEGTIDGTNYATLNIYPNQATAAASAVTSVSGVTGLWFANAAGIKAVRVNNSGVTGTACIGTLYGAPRDFTLPR